MEVAKLAVPPNLEVRFVSCNESAIKRWLSSELEETEFSLTHELFMTKHHTISKVVNSASVGILFQHFLSPAIIALIASCCSRIRATIM